MSRNVIVLLYNISKYISNACLEHLANVVMHHLRHTIEFCFQHLTFFPFVPSVFLGCILNRFIIIFGKQCCLKTLVCV